MKHSSNIASTVVAAFFCLTVGRCSPAAADAGFSRNPSVALKDGKAVISFSVTASTDAEVAVLDARGKVVRHLAAGVLGDNSPWPFRKWLSQELVWDGRDDDGKPVKAAKVRVSLGMKPTFDKIIGWNGKWLGQICGVAAGSDGMVYVMHRGDWVPHRHSWMITAFDKTGKYHHQVYPGPGDLPPEKRKGWPWVETTDGQKMPVVQQHLNRCVYPAARFHRRNFMVVTRDNRLIIPTGAKAGLRSEGPDIRGGRRLLILSTDGSVPENFLGPVFAPGDYGGFAHLALSPDEKYAYVAGFFEEKNRKARMCHAVWKVGLAAGSKPEIFAGQLFKPGKGAEGLNDPRGLAVDKAGNVFVADHGNNRVAVFKPDGSLKTEIAFNAPDQVKVSRKTGELAIMRTGEPRSGPGAAHWYSVGNGWGIAEIKQYKGIDDASPVNVFGPLKSRRNKGPAVFCMDDSGDSTIYYYVLGEQNGMLYRTAPASSNFKRTSVAGYYCWKREPEGNVGFTGDLACTGGTLLSSGASAWGHRGDKWTSFDASTGKYKGLWPSIRLKKKQGPHGGHGELVSGKDGNLYTQNMGPVSRFTPTGQPFPFSGLKNSTLRGLSQKHSKQTGLFVRRDGTIYVPSAAYVAPEKKGRKPDADLTENRIVVIGPDGNVTKKSAVQLSQTRVAGVAVDRQGNICLGTRSNARGKDVPEWINGRLPEGASQFSRLAYSQVASIIKFPPEGGGIKADPNGKWISCLHRKPQTAKLEKALFTVRAGLVPRKWGCYCETTRFDIDDYDRLYIPDTLRFSVLVVDGAGNEVARIGGYGNMDHRGPQSAHPEPAIAFCWPLSARICLDKLFVADPVNTRIVGVNIEYAAVETCDIR